MTIDEQIAALNIEPLTDEQLGEFLGLPKAFAETYVPRITPDVRAVYERMHKVEILAKLWISGAEPYPIDVTVNRGSRKRRKMGS